jgi:hypothetical protein
MNIPKITATTTDEQLGTETAAARKSLADMTTTADIETLTSLVHNVARKEEAARVGQAYRNMLQFEASPSAIAKHLTGLVLNGPSDDYSGRLNDMRRSAFDERLVTTRAIIEHIGEARS